jgi:hypothetical protein
VGIGQLLLMCAVIKAWRLTKLLERYQGIKVEQALLETVAHVAPQLGILAVIIVWQNKRMEKMEERMQGLLDDCWARFMSHLENDTK